MNTQNIGSNLEKDKIFSRWLLFTASIIATLLYLELNFFQIFKPQNDANNLMYQLGALAIPTLIFPIISFFVLMIDKANTTANKRAVFVIITQNKIYARRLDSLFEIEFTGHFSHENEIISDTTELGLLLGKAIRECDKDRKFYTPSPYIVFSSPVTLSQVQANAANQAINMLGVLDVKYIEKCTTAKEALDFVERNPTSFNIA